MPDNFLHLGEREVWTSQLPFGLWSADRARHLYLIGQTGTGKSTLMCNLVAQDIAEGAGLTLIDPHGDLAETVCDLIPTRRIDDVVVLDPTDIEHVPAVNPFYRVPIDDRPRVTSNVVATFKHAWSDSWGPRLEHILRNSVRLVLDAPDEARPSFISIARLLVERDHRERLLGYATDERVISFFQDEFDAWNSRLRTEALAPVQNKLGAVLANPFVRNIICQWKPTIDLPDVIDRQRILIVRVPKGTLGEDNASLIGSLIVSGLLQSAMSPREVRTPHHLFIDEFQSFTTDSFQLILSEARKFALTLTIGHQFVDQLTPETQAAVFGNVGNVVAFRVGGSDAERLARECRGIAAPRFADLQRGQVIARLLQDGEATTPFVGRTEPPSVGVGTGDRVRAKSRRAYTTPRQKVEQRLANWLQH